MLLSRRARSALQSVNSVSPRILVAEFDGNPITTVIVVFSPHNSSDEAEVEQLYGDLRAMIGQVPLHNFLAVLGNFNGPEDIRFTYHTEEQKWSKPSQSSTRAGPHSSQHPISETTRKTLDIPREGYRSQAPDRLHHRVVSMRVRLSLLETTKENQPQRED